MRKILSVDDDPNILHAYEVAIGQKGYEILTTTDPNAVESLLRDNDVDLIMLDIHMPQLSGLDIFRDLKKTHPKLKVLFITAYPKTFTVSNDDIYAMWTQNFADGETDIMYKPFVLNLLYEKIEGLIGPAS